MKLPKPKRILAWLTREKPPSLFAHVEGVLRSRRVSRFAKWEQQHIGIFATLEALDWTTGLKEIEAINRKG